MANDVRFRRPAPILRSNPWVWTYLEFYGASTLAIVELYAYTSSGQALYYPFTDSNSIQTVTYSGLWNGSSYTPRVINLHWLFDNMTVAQQAIYFECWIYSSQSALLDYA